MSIKLGSAYGKVSIDASGVTNGVNTAKRSMSSLEESARKLGTTLQNVGKAMTVAVSVPLALMAKDAVMTASAFEESLNKVNVVFEKNSEKIIEWSEDAAKKLGMSQQQALEAAATFGNLFDTIGMNADRNAEMSQSLVQLATDLASMHNISVDEALLKLRAGLVGEVEPLRTVGVLLNQVAVDAKAMELGLVGANGELTESAKVQARYALILEQTTNAQGDFARTSGSLANQLRTLKASWGDTLKILGDMLLPIVTKLLVHLNKFLDWFNNADPKTQKFIATLLLIAFVAGPLLIIFGKLLPLAFAGVTKSINPFSGGIFGLIGTIVKFFGVAAIIVKVLAALGVATGPVGAAILAVQVAIAGVGASIFAVVGPILLIIATLVLLYLAFKNNFMGITTTVKQLWEIIKYYFNLIVKWMVDVFRKINWSQVGKYILYGIANGMMMGIPQMVAAAVAAAKAALKAFDSVFDFGSPSKEMEKRGGWTAMGWIRGMKNNMDPNVMAKEMAKPVLNHSISNSTSNVFQFANGLTIHDVDRLMDRKLERFTRKLDQAIGGA